MSEAFVMWSLSFDYKNANNNENWNWNVNELIKQIIVQRTKKNLFLFVTIWNDVWQI